MANVGNCHRSKVSPHRTMMRRVYSSASTTSVLRGRWGPCCSMEPIGMQRIELARRHFETSGNVRSPICRLGTSPFMDATIPFTPPSIDPADARRNDSSVASRCQRGLRLRGIANGSDEMAEPVPGPSDLCGHIATVVGIYGCLKRHSAYDLNSRLGEAIEFGRVIGEESDACAFEHLKHACCNTIVALVVVEAEGSICVDGIEAVILQLVGAHLVGETDAAALLRETENKASTEVLYTCNREAKLVATVTAPRAEYISCQACRMQPHGHRFGEVGFPDDDRNLVPTHRVAES